MRFRTYAVAAVLLVLLVTGGLAGYQISADARGEAAQVTVERSDSLAVEPEIRQTLVADQNHTPTRYGDTVTVVYNGTEWDAAGNYTYYQDSGEIEFLRDEAGEAAITYTYEIPENQVADAQLQTLTESWGQIATVGTGVVFIVLFLFVGGFVARRAGMFGGGSGPRGR
jgi:hypothetical protein